jgi:hypothetical protein
MALSVPRGGAQRQGHTARRTTDMPVLEALLFVVLPIAALAVLVADTRKLVNRRGELPTPTLLYRAYGA